MACRSTVCGLRGAGTWAQLLHVDSSRQGSDPRPLIHWHLDSSRPGVRPTPSALAGGFLSTGTWNPPGQGSDPRPLHWQVDSYPLARGLLPARGQTHILCIGRWILIHWHVESSQPGVRPTSSALAGGFLSTAPPRKSGKYFDTNLSNRCETIPHCGFDLHFSVS